MNYDVADSSEGLTNEALLILQPFRRRFTYVTGTSPAEPPMHVRNISLLAVRAAMIRSQSFRSVAGSGST